MFGTKLSVAVVAVVAAIGAQAAVAQATSYGPHDPWFANAVSYNSAASPSFTTDTLAPGGGTSAPVRGYRFITDTLAPGGGGSGVVSTPSASGFDWGDAGIGAGATAGLMLGLLGSARLLAGRRRPLAA
ncbi:MAG: hypothetical protein ACXVRJ_10090 [Gaiellaceae bacterium]